MKKTNELPIMLVEIKKLRNIEKTEFIKQIMEMVWDGFSSMMITMRTVCLKY